MKKIRIALPVLAGLAGGGIGCEAVLRRFAADTTGYDSVRFKENERGEQSDRTVTVQRFAKAALAG